MTKPKGCLGVVAVLLVVGGLVGVVTFSRIRSARMRPVDDEKPPVSLEVDTEAQPRSPADSENRIVVPETIILTEPPSTGDRGNAANEIRAPALVWSKSQVDDEGRLKKFPSFPSETTQVLSTNVAKSVAVGENDVRNISMIDPQTVNFDPYGVDTLVFIHIQKTGGTDFLRHLITATKNGKYLCNLSDDTQRGILDNSLGVKGVFGRHIMCPRDRSNPEGEQWLVSEKNLGWICQLHTSYSEFKVCIPKLKGNPKINTDSHFFYTTILRHPVLRYMSEYLHVRRNATWAKRRICDGKKVNTVSEMPPCYPGYYSRKPWVNVTIEKFMACSSNWGNNRQTRMLSDLELLGCYGNELHPPEEKARLMLQSAKDNLRNFAFFGLTEYQEETRLLFEKQFGIRLKLETQQRSMSALHSAPILQDLWNNSELYDKIAEVNRLDMELYEYALELFSKRVKTVLGMEIDPDHISDQIESMDASDLRRSANKFRKYNLHGEFENGRLRAKKAN